MKRIFKLLPLMIFLALVLLFFRGLHIDPHELPSALLHQAMPAFDLTRLDNSKEHVNEKVFLGQMHLLNVFATWCVSCVVEHPMLMRMAHDNKVSIYGLDYKDQRAAAIAYLQRYGNPYQAVLFDQTGQVAIDLGVYGTPETFVVDEKGYIIYKHIGPITKKVWEEKLAKFFIINHGLAKP